MLATTAVLALKNLDKAKVQCFGRCSTLLQFENSTNLFIYSKKCDLALANKLLDATFPKKFIKLFRN